MTGFPDGPELPPDGSGTPADSGGPDRRDEGSDPVERLLRSPGGYLAAPPGTFERVRRRAARRRRARALAGGTAAAAVIAGALFLTGVIAPGGDGTVVGPPADRSLASGVPTPSGRPTPTPGTPSATGGQSTHTPAGRPSATPSSGAASSAPDATPTTPPTSADTAPMCTAAQLSAGLGGSDAGAGNLYRYLVITNKSATTCRVAGYPGLSLLDANGRQIGQPATRDARTYAAVVLQPGAAASDTIHTVNQQGTCLAASAQLRMYPPGSKASLTFDGQVTVCDDTFEITPFVAGRTGNPPS
ncbi:hypothetical protein RVR_100 [Actinacidiphila reveromycinica]|uniref:DUF4232 domain-containing protein n=1 Tax=Actinacidiphila reveromycinica TaxID=659352 RepID=A0A7U3UMK1_9ACTN|nr:DUF4232 domain-containing protein [Streptomyces sp. SN-593]BBA95296.1 hypothetical protein RVR_100 [Streptomyces sp. SN-593]